MTKDLADTRYYAERFTPNGRAVIATHCPTCHVSESFTNPDMDTARRAARKWGRQHQCTPQGAQP